MACSFLAYLCHMNLPDSLTDKQLGIIRIRINARARHLILRIGRDGSVVMTVPPGTSESSVRQMVEQYRTRVQARQTSVAQHLIDASFTLDTPFFKLSLSESQTTHFQLRTAGAELTLLYPRGTDFHTADMQAWLRKVITEALRRRAKEVLPQRIAQLSKTHSLPFNSIKINTSKGRWGSCSTRKDINLSCFLMLLPEELVDYVILHELCHTLEMNHSPRFWAHLDRHTAGRAKDLRKELRTHRTDF